MNLRVCHLAFTDFVVQLGRLGQDRLEINELIAYTKKPLLCEV